MAESDPINLQELRSAIPGGRVLEITTATGCIVGCSYCPQDKFVSRQKAVSQVKHLGLEEFRRCLGRVPTDVDISFAGYSEPWLNPDCTEMVEHAYMCGHGIRVFTTLVGMNRRDLRRLQALRFRVFVVHVFDDGMYMNGRLVRAKYLDLIRQLVDSDIPSIRFLVLGEVHPDIVGIIPAGALYRTRPLSSRGGSVDPKIVETRPPVVGALTCAEARQYRNVLLPNGDVTLCCMDFERRHVLGNLLRDEYKDLFEGPVFREVVDCMNGMDGFLLCRICEFAEPKTSACSFNAGETADPSFLENSGQ
ncbi:radical SAM/SPASM domain-containing protein [Ensifer sp. BR816]|uniref:radical SAM/SPASM domain-containing protein n=1 Tax=Rhizobium sp. (strain BR816) TaxID=1057002 RepID=UPI000379BA42|nr:radical SAM/SPASM domain-containing protein [Ensifer sp. BR816]